MFSGLQIEWDRLREVLAFDQQNPLLFNTGLFLLLFVGFLAIYSILRKFKTVKRILVILF